VIVDERHTAFSHLPPEQGHAIDNITHAISSRRAPRSSSLSIPFFFSEDSLDNPHAMRFNLTFTTSQSYNIGILVACIDNRMNPTHAKRGGPLTANLTPSDLPRCPERRAMSRSQNYDQFQAIFAYRWQHVSSIIPRTKPNPRPRNPESRFPPEYSHRIFTMQYQGPTTRRAFLSYAIYFRQPNSTSNVPYLYIAFVFSFCREVSC